MPYLVHAEPLGWLQAKPFVTHRAGVGVQAERRYVPTYSYGFSKLASILTARELQRRFNRCAVSALWHVMSSCGLVWCDVEGVDMHVQVHGDFITPARPSMRAAAHIVTSTFRAMLDT